MGRQKLSPQRSGEPGRPEQDDVKACSAGNYALEASGDRLRETGREAVKQVGVVLLGQLHRAHHVGEQHRHLLALALQGGAAGADLLDEVLWRMGTRVGRMDRRCSVGRRLAAAVAVPSC